MSNNRVGPIQLGHERVTIDGDWRPAFHFTDREGDDIDLTASGVDAWVEIRPVASGSTITRKKSNSGEYAYVNTGTDGQIEFIFLAAAIAALSGTYNVDVWYVVSGSSIKRKMAEGTVGFESERT